MKHIIICALLGDYSKVAEAIEKETNNHVTRRSELSNIELKKLIVNTSAENKQLKKENTFLREENEKITDLASRTSVALAQPKQGISDAVDISEANYKEQQKD